MNRDEIKKVKELSERYHSSLRELFQDCVPTELASLSTNPPLSYLVSDFLKISPPKFRKEYSEAKRTLILEEQIKNGSAVIIHPEGRDTQAVSALYRKLVFETPAPHRY
ncbi:hypothetical protein COU57_00705 [Candidatus Pacearchaeota archaeon CG10_big_fil_rev_8_21_14_0_10_32_14]|nr:MAG: hypothetical protein COU57_00705 [Candidatus Pacearchaeota archaeon CG10_big_fil_rev_8_21_14_0_10_32_14]